MIFGNKDKIELKVTGMTCGHCEAKIEEAVSKLPGVKKVTASRTSQKVTLETDKPETLDLKKIKATIESLGYQAAE
jgi:copper ion binding protein